MHQTALAAMVMFAALTCACAKSPKVEKTDPFVVPKKQFYTDTQVVALAPITMPEGLPNPEPIKSEFARLIVAKLESGGFLPVRTYDFEAWGKYVTDFDALLDANTGERDEETLVTAALHTVTDLEAGFEADAVLIPSIVVAEATFMGGKAWWDGTSQRIQTQGPLSEFLGGSPEGRVQALSLRISVWGADGKLLYVKSGGIESLSVAEGEEFSPVPRQNLFSDRERVAASVDIALDPFVSR